MNRYDKRLRQLQGYFIGAAVGQQQHHLDEGQLAGVEAQLGAALPEDYREFLRDYGVFGIPMAVFPFKDEEDACGSVEVFYGVMPSSPDLDIITFYEGMRADVIVALDEQEVNWPSGWLPIGSDAGSNQVVLVIEGQNKGAVFLFDNQGARVHPVAASFDEFMHLLEPRPEE